METEFVMQRLAHLSDIHLPPVPFLRLRDISMKRVLGYANWHRRRKQRHQIEVIDLLLADMRAQQPDQILITGDLVNLGLPLEFIKAEQWVRELGTPEKVSLIPGNHDIYVRMLRDPGIWRLADYMACDAAGGQYVRQQQRGFPYVRLRGEIALIGLNSGIPTAPFVASGRLGSMQLDSVRQILRDLGRKGFCRVVMIHHPPLPGQAKAARGLRDAAPFREVLREVGAELVLHGHNHKQMLTMLETVTGPLPVVGVPAASVAPPHHGDLARYNLFDIVRSASGEGACCWQITMTGRALTPDGATIETCEELVLVG